jgi:transcriptional regulator with XRE-family HTH domain
MEIIIFNETFSQNLRYLRRKKGISQKKLAEMMEFSVYYLRNVELCRREAVLTYQELKLLCSILETNVEGLLHGEFAA